MRITFLALALTALTACTTTPDDCRNAALIDYANCYNAGNHCDLAAMQRYVDCP